MAKSLFLVASLLLLVVPLSLAVAATTTEPKSNGDEKQIRTKNVGGYNPIKNITDPYIQSLGKFAVDEHNKQAKTQLKFLEVYEGKYQIVAGTNYDLRLRAVSGGLIRTYGTIVFVDLKKKPYLQDFYGISRKIN